MAERRMNVRRLFLALCEDGLVEDGMGKLSLKTVEAQQRATILFLAPPLPVASTALLVIKMSICLCGDQV